MTHSLVRLVRAAGSVQVLLRRRFPRIMRVLAPQRAELPALFAELQRIESDLAYRVRFFAGLNAAIAERNAARVAELEALRTAVDQLRGPACSAGGARSVHPAADRAGRTRRSGLEPVGSPPVAEWSRPIEPPVAGQGPQVCLFGPGFCPWAPGFPPSDWRRKAS
ncbi:hypothetical protein [Streptomyces sp. NBC_00388]|uniref:hypothetical protein n=1 Tax=Streptomyces sp. NBC_00388 TaxID=2975735 RepID=UPI002E21B9EA